ncbi:MAG TPA: TM2 domain-containing protein [Spirochaetia bacterium]|nr:TM2 domain-containing protein [Spirochaetia bacterium]
MYSTGIAYLLLFLFGWSGAHRFYLGKIGSGFLYLCTGGLFGIGWLYDLFTLPSQVREANLRLAYHSAIFGDGMLKKGSRYPDSDERQAEKRKSIELAILKTAKKNGGVATPGEVALEGGISIDDAKAALETLIKKGYAELKVTKEGGVVYFFPEFASGVAHPEFEDF